MIKHSVITPTKFINDPEIWGRGDFILALSHLIDDNCENEYTEAIMSSWRDIWLDNGLFENGTPEDHNSLLMKAIRIGAIGVFASDYLYDAESSKEALERMVQIRNLQKIRC